MLWLVLVCLVVVIAWLQFERQSTSTSSFEKVKLIQDSANAWMNEAIEPYRASNFNENSIWFISFTSLNDPLRAKQLVPIRTRILNLMKTINAQLPFVEIQSICTPESNEEINTRQSVFGECILNKIWSEEISTKPYILVRELREYVTPIIMLCLITLQIYMEDPERYRIKNHPLYLLQIKNNEIRLKTAEELKKVNDLFKDWFQAVTPAAYRSVIERFGKPKLTDEQYNDAVNRARSGQPITVEELRLFLIAVYLATPKLSNGNIDLQ
jgi:hypothetical protein